MKIQFEHEERTSLTLIPEIGADELLLAAILRIFMRGGVIHFVDSEGEGFQWSLSEGRADIKDDLESKLNEYIKCLRVEKE